MRLVEEIDERNPWSMFLVHCCDVYTMCSKQYYIQLFFLLRLILDRMAEVECITLDEDEDQDLLQGAGRMASHPQMVRWSLKLVNFTSVCSQVRCAMCVDPGLLPMETDMAKHRREVLTQLMRNGRVIEL